MERLRLVWRVETLGEPNSGDDPVFQVSEIAFFAGRTAKGKNLHLPCLIPHPALFNDSSDVSTFKAILI